MSRLYFGTDGVRGPYGGPVINEDFAARLGCEWEHQEPARKRVPWNHHSLDGLEVAARLVFVPVGSPWRE